MSTSDLFNLAKALALTTSIVPAVLAAESGKTQVAVTTESHTFTAVQSFGEVILVDGSSTATIDPGQHTKFNGVSVSALPERTAIVVDGSATYGFTHPVSDPAGPAPSPSAFGGGAGLPYAIVSASGDISITVSPYSSSYVLEVSTTTTTIGAGDAASFAGASISALSSNSPGVVANDFTFTLEEVSMVTPSPSSPSSTTSTRAGTDTTLISGTNRPTSSSDSTDVATTPAPSSTSGDGDAAPTQSITGGAAATFTSGDLSIAGWLAGSIGMLMFAFGL